VLIKRSVYQSPDHSVPSAKDVCKQGELNVFHPEVLSKVVFNSNSM